MAKEKERSVSPPVEEKVERKKEAVEEGMGKGKVESEEEVVALAERVGEDG